MFCRGIAMQRLYGAVEDSLLPLVDADAMQKKVSRAQWVGNVIASYLNHNGETNDAEIDRLTTEIHRLNTEIDRLNIELDRKALEMAHLEATITMKDGEINHLRYLTNDLRSLADNMATKIPTPPALTQKTEEEIAECRHHWWQFWRRGQAIST